MLLPVLDTEPLFQPDAPIELPVARLPFSNKPACFWARTQAASSGP